MPTLAKRLISPVSSQIVSANILPTPATLTSKLSGYPRLGETGESLTLVEGMDTVDVSSTGRYPITGHEYLYFNPVVTADLVVVLSTGAPAGERSGLQARTREGIRYWEFAGTAGD